MEIKTEKEDYHEVLDYNLVKEEYVVQENPLAEANEDIPDSKEAIQFKIQEISEEHKHIAIQDEDEIIRPRKLAKKGQYSDQELDKALTAIANGIPVSKVAREFQIPRTTLRNIFSRKSPGGPIRLGGYPNQKSIVEPRKGMKKAQYSEQELDKALSAIAYGIPVSRVAREYQIPRTTLRNKFSGKSPRGLKRHGGYHSLLGKKTEETIAQWIVQSASQGFPVSRDGLLTTVEKLVADSPDVVGFKEKRPSKKWYYNFLNRHPEVAAKKTEYVNRTRRNITKEKIHKWFKDVEYQLDDHIAILEHPERIFNLDELVVHLNPKGELVLGPMGRHVFIEYNNADKESISTVLCVNALGTFVPPLTVFKYERLPAIATKSAPTNWDIGKSDSGCMNPTSFYEYITCVFHPFLENRKIERPVVIFLDGHSAHLTMHLSSFCRDQGIILVALPPNSAFILQPFDIAIFQPIKARWGFMKRAWKNAHDGIEATKFDIANILNKAITEDYMVQNIISGFRTTGLYPFDVNSVDCSKIYDTDDENLNENFSKIQQNSQRMVKSCLDMMESKISPDIVNDFKKTLERGEDWTGDIIYEGLYYVWKDLMLDMEEDSIRKQETHTETTDDSMKWSEPQEEKCMTEHWNTDNN